MNELIPSKAHAKPFHLDPGHVFACTTCGEPTAMVIDRACYVVVTGEVYCEKHGNVMRGYWFGFGP